MVNFEQAQLQSLSVLQNQLRPDINPTSQNWNMKRKIAQKQTW